MDSKSPKVLPRKRKANHVGQSPKEIPTNVSPATPTENGDGTSIWDNNFPFGDFIDKHFITEEDRKAFENWGIEECFHVLKATPVQEVSLIRLMEQKVGDLLKKNKAYDEENTELKKDLKELILRNNQLVEREEGLIEKIIKKEKIVYRMRAETKDLKAEIEDLKAKMEELRDEIQLQQKTGFDKAIKQVLVSISELKP
ncbi:hypothetical protein L195_g032546 [Trifolium pratense]|uniref:Uncharacterized protein n=1 Tax=Trifolium pratense TaxID=57577 RepID=A0A2K3LDH1_TRIPR|nr:hypothetical protein L195_g032546 [Trifolium pratense]